MDTRSGFIRVEVAAEDMRDRLEDFASEFASAYEEDVDLHTSENYWANATSKIKVDLITGDGDIVFLWK